MGEGLEKPVPPWAQKRGEEWKRIKASYDLEQDKVFRSPPTEPLRSAKSGGVQGARDQERPTLDREVRDRAHGGRVRGDSAEEKKLQPSVQQYHDGISLSKYDAQQVLDESPSERATELLEEIMAGWKKSKINEKGERVVMSKKDKKETFWGDWISAMFDRTRAWQDKERAYIRQKLPRSLEKRNEQSHIVIPTSFGKKSHNVEQVRLPIESNSEQLTQEVAKKNPDKGEYIKKGKDALKKEIEQLQREILQEEIASLREQIAEFEKS